jgi:type II secretory pathway pseudopilin PulG
MTALEKQQMTALEPTRSPPRDAERAAKDAGFTMIELVVSMFIGILVIGAAALIFANSNDSSLASQRQFSLGSVLQQQIENIRATVDRYGFGALAMTSTPTAVATSTDPTSPDAFITGSGCSATFTVQANYNSTSEAFASGSSIPDSPESLVVNGCTVAGTAISGGQLTPVQYADLTTGVVTSSAPASDPYATVYIFVTQTSEAGCSNVTTNACGADLRRVVVAAVLSAEGTDIGTNYPQYSTTVFANPVATDQSNTASTLELF